MTRPRVLAGVVFCALLANALLGCANTLDSLGQDPDSNGAADSGPAPPLGALTGPASYPNAFRTLLGKSDVEISAKVEAAFAQLFHGDPITQSIYFPVGTDRAYIQDVLHGDIRSEGIGIGMLVAVELDKREEFDRLWTYAKASLEQRTGPAQGYFNSFCDDTTPCLDPYGMQQFVTALLFANDRWTSSADAPYASDARALLDALKNKELENGGAALGLTSVFDATTQLVREQPTLDHAGYTRSSLEMPAAYELWAQASADPFWRGAAAAGRAHLLAAADATTGLWPMRSYFDGSAVKGSEVFSPQAYRTHLNLALDALWGTAGPNQTALADRVLGFFAAQGLDKYGATFTLAGVALDPNREQGLIAVNGALAVAASRANRAAFVNAVWTQAIPSGDIRYYDGVLYLMSLLILSGQFRVY